MGALLNFFTRRGRSGSALAAPLAQLEQRIGHSFRDPALLELAFTHTSWVNDHLGESESNQRLEFLGDAVLQLVMTEALFQLFPEAREGQLSKRRAALTKGAFLAGLARELSLDTCLRLGAGEEASGGRARAAALADAFEALVGALYVDAGLPGAARVVLGLYGDLHARLAVENSDNPKGRLQEKIQPTHGNDALRYDVVQASGAAHERSYEVAVFLHDRQLGLGHGTSKKLAEESAARAALETLNPDPQP